MFAFCLDLSPFLIQRHYVFHISCPSDHAAVLFLFFPLHCYPLGNLKFKVEGDWEPASALRVKSGNHCPSFKFMLAQ